MNPKFIRSVLSVPVLLVNLRDALDETETWVRLEGCVIREKCKHELQRDGLADNSLACWPSAPNGASDLQIPGLSTSETA